MTITKLPEFGFFVSAEQIVPEHDPGVEIACHICNDRLDGKPMKTVSFLWINGNVSYFYRVHKSCATPEIESFVESFIVDSEMPHAN